jgi:hypothetical protein
LNAPGLTLAVLSGSFAVCRLDPGSAIPSRLLELDFFSVTRTERETSLVVAEDAPGDLELPAGSRIERGWACLEVAGPLDFSLIGVLATLTGTLAAAGVAVFAISTYDTDYLLVKKQDLGRAMEALSAAGHAARGG